MKRLIGLVLCLFVLLPLPCMALQPAPTEALTLSAPSALLMHMDDMMLYIHLLSSCLILQSHV